MVTYNGEIYNYLELRGAIARVNGSFTPHPTPSAFLASLCRRGASAAFRAFAECSLSGYGTSAERRFVAARDRFGIKPFYYAVVDDTLYFASEIKALLPFLARDRDRRGGAGRIPDFPVHDRRAYPV